MERAEAAVGGDRILSDDPTRGPIQTTTACPEGTMKRWCAVGLALMVVGLDSSGARADLLVDDFVLVNREIIIKYTNLEVCDKMLKKRVKQFGHQKLIAGLPWWVHLFVRRAWMNFHR